jgi:hypothetical protein
MAWGWVGAPTDGPDDEDDRPVDPPDGMDWDHERTR